MTTVPEDANVVGAAQIREQSQALQALLLQLSTHALVLAEQLDQAASGLRAGMVPERTVDEALVAFRTRFEELSGDVGALMPSSSATAQQVCSIADLKDVLESAVAQAAASEVEEVRSEIARLSEQLKQARLETSKVGIRAIIEELRADLVRLEAAASRASDGVAQPPTAGEGQHGGTAFSDEVVDAGGGLAGTPTPTAPSEVPEPSAPSRPEEDGAAVPSPLAVRVPGESKPGNDEALTRNDSGAAPKAVHRKMPPGLPTHIRGSYALGGGCPYLFRQAPGEDEGHDARGSGARSDGPDGGALCRCRRRCCRVARARGVWSRSGCRGQCWLDAVAFRCAGSESAGRRGSPGRRGSGGRA